MKLFETIAHLFHPRRSNNHRPKLLHPEAVAYLVGIAVTLSFFIQFAPRQQSLSNVLGYSSDITTDKVLTQTNQLRSQGSLSSLQYSDRLSQAAIAKGQDMFANQYWAHTSPSGREPWDFIRAVGYGYRVAGENLARDFNTTDSMMEAWMASPTHRENIMHPRYKEIGIAVIDGTLNGVETTLVVQMFGLPVTTQVAQVPDSTLFGIDQAQAAEIQNETGENLPATESEPALEIKAEPQDVPAEDPSLIPQQAQQVPQQDSLPSSAVQPENTLRYQPFFSPLELTKATFIAVTLMLLATLVYDALIIANRKTERFVGKNLAHIIIFSMVLFVLIVIKGGAIA
ncbi:MAG: CAP domain-containing protein [Microgenomates group bacterium]